MFSHATLEFFKSYLNNIPTNYLEIGVYNGESIKELAALFPDKTIVGIDPFIEDGCTSHDSGVGRGESLVAQRQSTFVDIKNYKNIKFFNTTSEQFYADLTADLIGELNIGAVYIDGSHWYKDVVIDYNLALKLLGDKGGAVCFDDLHVDDVLKACNEFISVCGDRILDRINLTNSNSVFILK